MMQKKNNNIRAEQARTARLAVEVRILLLFAIVIMASCGDSIVIIINIIMLFSIGKVSKYISLPARTRPINFSTRLAAFKEHWLGSWAFTSLK